MPVTWAVARLVRGERAVVLAGSRVGYRARGRAGRPPAPAPPTRERHDGRRAAGPGPHGPSPRRAVRAAVRLRSRPAESGGHRAVGPIAASPRPPAATPGPLRTDARLHLLLPGGRRAESNTITPNPMPCGTGAQERPHCVGARDTGPPQELTSPKSPARNCRISAVMGSVAEHTGRAGQG